MKIFEFHFNPLGRSPTGELLGHRPTGEPKGKEDLVFDSFCYEPENVYERRLGSLFLVGELKNTLPQNLKFLDNFASFFKKEYYSAPLKSSPESSLKLGLKKANEFLENILKSGDVSWLGNLNAAILSIKNFDLNFTKVGALKILLFRQGQITDLGKNLELEEIDPYPLKIFGKIVSGKLVEGDIVLVLTKEIFNFFSGQNLLRKITQLQSFDENRFKTILKTKENELLKISGVCLALLPTKEVWPETQRQKSFTFQSKTEKFSFKKVFLPLTNLVKRFAIFRASHEFGKPRLLLSNILLKLKGIGKKPQKPKKVKVRVAENLKLKNTIKIPKINIALPIPKIKLPALFNKNLILLSSLIFILLAGFFIFKIQEQRQLKRYETVLNNVQENISQAEQYLALNNEVKAFSIYKKARQDILPLAEQKSALQNEAISLKNSIDESLEKISKLEKIPDPKMLFEFNEKEFIPQKMVFFNDNLYFFSPLANNLYQLSPAGEKNILQIEQPFNEAAVYDSQLLFFQKPNLIFFLKNGNFSQPISLNLPYADFDPKAFAAYRSSLYFLDTQTGEIIKYAYPLSENKDFPQTWLVGNAKKVTGAKSIAIDGPVWILNKDNTISQYYTGTFRKTITPDFFPQPENLSSIQALYGLFYILEPVQKRIIVLTENGSIVKQWQSEKFDNLKDFAVSDDGGTIWLLNGVKIYEVSF